MGYYYVVLLWFNYWVLLWAYFGVLIISLYFYRKMVYLFKDLIEDI